MDFTATIKKGVLKTPTMDLSAAAKMKNGGAAAYWGYKAFQSLRICSGDVTALAEIATELLGEGLCAGAVANPALVVEAVENVVGAYGGIKAFRKNVNNFAQFSAALAKQLNSDGKPQTNGTALESAEHLYKTFTECDRDGSGGVSLEEYVVFSAKEGVDRSTAEIMFFQADVDGNGQISFEEWTAMMAGRAGRDKDSFNCGGHHGLTQYTVVINGLSCDFCEAPIVAGSLAKGCRRCDCDACASCCMRYSSPLVPPAPPRRPGEERKKVSTKKKKTTATTTTTTKKKKKKAVQPKQQQQRRKIYVPSSLPPSTAVAIRRAHPDAEVIVERPRVFDCRKRHGLSLFTVKVGAAATCDWCGVSVPAGRRCLGCESCNQTGCLSCAADSLAAPDGNASCLTCPGRHGLVPTQRAAVSAAVGGCVCDFCLGAVAGGAKVYACSACGVDACIACVWTDHRRALSTGGMLTCANFKAHAPKELHIASEQQLSHRCNWCLGAPSLGHRMMRCDPCDCDTCGPCAMAIPAQQAKVERVKAAAKKASRAAKKADKEAAERLQKSLDDGAGTGAASKSPATTTSGELPPSKSPAPSPRPTPPPGYGAVAAPSHDGGQAAGATAEAVPPYHEMAGLSLNGSAGGPPTIPAAAAAAPSYEEMAMMSSLSGGKQQQQEGDQQLPPPPPYTDLTQGGGTGEAAGEGEDGTKPPTSASQGQKTTEPEEPAAGGADMEAESPFAFDSIVRVLGVEDPEVDGKLLTVIGFEADDCGGSGIVVLRRRGRVVQVPASNVYRIME